MVEDELFEDVKYWKGRADAEAGKLETALAQRDALQKALDQIRYIADKASAVPAERLQDIRVILGRVGGVAK